MRTISAEELLNAWEQGLNQPLLQRALILLTVAHPEIQPDDLLELSIGQRDHRLLQLRENLFGQQLLNSAVCPECGQRIEWENDITEFSAQPQSNTASNEFDFETNDYTFRFRLPNSLDIASTTNNESMESAQKILLSRCLIKIEHSGESRNAGQLPSSIIEKLNQQIEAQDPHANIQIQLNCPECSHNWNTVFDIASFLWSEVNDWAQKMLQIVHLLAAGYGWNEKEILQLSPVRRQLYLGMLGR